MSKHQDLETEDHGSRSPTQHGESRDPKRVGRAAPESVQPLQIQRVAAQSSSPRAVERAVQRFLQRSGGAAPPQPDDDLGARIQMHAGGGTGLDPSAKGKLEGAMGADLSGVRVHNDGEADKMARSVDAVAFTSGQDVFFREGAYNPGTQDGMKLLAHEATHTVQQSQGPVSGAPTHGGVSVSDPSDSFEQAAAQAADKVVEEESGGAQPSAHGRENAGQAQRAVQREAATAISPNVQARNWPSMLPKAGGQANSSLDANQTAVLDALRRQRAQLTEDIRLHLVNFGKKKDAGYVYSGKSQGDPDPSELLHQASDEKKRDIRINWLVWSELKSEGGDSASSINTFDNQLLTWGRGFSGAGQLQEVMQTLFDAQSIHDVEARDMFLDAGIALENGKLLVVNPENGLVAEGRAALELLQFNKALLSLFIAIAEDPAHSQNVVNAQYRLFKKHAGYVPDFVYKEWREDKDENIALLAHLSHWLPSYGWETHPTEYQNTYGDLEKILIAFGKLVGELKSPSGAYIIPHYLRVLGEERLLKFGEGVGMKGAAMEAFKGQAPLELTEKEIAENESYRDHIFFPIEGKAAYYALPAVPTPPEKGKEPPAQAAPAKADGSDTSSDKDKNKDKGKNTGKGKGANTGKK